MFHQVGAGIDEDQAMIVDSVMMENEKLEEENKQLRADLREAEQDANDLRRRAAVAARMQQQPPPPPQPNPAVVAGLRGEVRQAQEAVAQLQAAVRARDATCEGLRAKRRAAQEDAQQHQETARGLEARAGQAQAALRTAQQERDAAVQETQTLRRRSQQDGGHRDAAMAENEKLAKQNRQLQADLVAAKQNVAVLRRAAALQQQQPNPAVIDGLRGEVRQAKDAAAQLQATVHERDATCQRLRAERTAAKGAAAQAKTELRAAKADTDAARQEVQALRRQATAHNRNQPASPGRDAEQVQFVRFDVGSLGTVAASHFREPVCTAVGCPGDHAGRLCGWLENGLPARGLAAVAQEAGEAALRVNQEDLMAALHRSPHALDLLQTLSRYSSDPSVFFKFIWHFSADGREVYRSRRLALFVQLIEGVNANDVAALCRAFPQGAAALLWVLDQVRRHARDVFAGQKDKAAEIVRAVSKLRTDKTHHGMFVEVEGALQGVKQVAVPFGRHANDPQDFRSVSIPPTLEDLEHGLPQELVKQLGFIAVPGVRNVNLHLERHFRLLRHDTVSEIGEAYNEVCAFNAALEQQTGMAARAAARRNLERAAPYSLTEATVSAEGSDRGRTCLELTGKVQLPDKHPLWRCKDDRRKKEWLTDAKTFFQSSCVVFIMAKDTRKNPTVLAQVAKFEYQKVPFVKGKCVQLMLKVLTETPLQKGLPYTVLATRHQWSGISDLLRQLQCMESPFPFGPQLLGLQQPKPIAPPARYQTVMSDTLKPRQREGVIDALTKNVSLIQGPPGTGKTHTATEIAKCLLQGGDGEFLVIIAYTNHALDQLMQRVHEKVGEACTFARLGNAKKSSFVSKRLDFNKVPRDEHIPAQRRIKFLEGKIERLGPTPGGFYWDNDLAEKYGLGCLDLTEHEEDWLAKTKAFKLSDVFWHLISEWANNKKAKSETKLPGMLASERSATKARMSAFSHSQQERQRILREMKDECVAQRSRAKDELCAAFQSSEELKHSYAAEVVTERVVGCTTSYAAKHPALLRALAARGSTTLMVEEAAEILEANVLACLSDSLDRLILIGDHKQLRPKVEQHRLSVAGSDVPPKGTEVDYRGTDFNRSLFERLVIGNFPCVALNIQHRMFPRLAGVVQRLAYPDLTSAPQAPKDGVHIPGIRGQLLFVNHDFPDGRGGEFSNDSTSMTNKREAEYAVEIAWYMIQRGARPEDIAILSPYLGQVNAISTLLKQRDLGAKHDERDQADLDKLVGVADESEAKQPAKMIRVASVDNFQGEESRYIVLSLVRSNCDGQVGWVKETERVTVMLSRAKEGMIVLGNTHTLLKKARPDSAWCKVLRDLGQDGLVVQGLPLVCKNHPSFHRSVASAEELRRAAPSGGCTRECGRQMPCGHVCPDRCHFDDPGHTEKRKRCPAPVEHVCGQNKLHIFNVRCGEAGRAVCPFCVREKELQAKAEKEQKEAEQRHKTEMRKHEEAKKALEKERVALEAKRKHAEKEDKVGEVNRQEAEKLQQLEAAYQRNVQKLAKDHQDAKALSAARIERIKEQRAKGLQAAKEEAEAKLADMHKKRRDKEEKDRRRMEEAHRLLAADTRRVQARLQGEIDTVQSSDELLDKRVDCAVCGADENDDLTVRESAKCDHGHYYHLDCFESMVDSQLRDPVKAHTGEIACEFCKGGKEMDFLMHHATVRSFLDDAKHDAFDRHRLAAREAAAQEEGAQRAKQQFENEGVAGRVVRVLREEVLTLRCPRCKVAFVDFEGCCALMCGGCSCGFCAYCLEDCGQDAHAHVAKCVPGGMFCSSAKFEEHQEKRKRRMSRERIEKEGLSDVQKRDIWMQLFGEGEAYPTKP